MEYAYYMALFLSPIVSPLVFGTYMIWSAIKLKRIEKLLKKFEIPYE